MKLFGKLFSAIAVVILATAAFAQTGTVNFVNQTSSTLRFLLNGNPACAGDVIPNGSCSETVNAGNYFAQATNGQQTTGGKSFTIVGNDTFTYTVYEQQSNTGNNNPNLWTVTLKNVNYLSNNAFDATFIGDVVTSQARNDANTSTAYQFTSDSTDVMQQIVVREIDHDIDVNLASSNFYADQYTVYGDTAKVINRSTGTYQGHPYTYTCVTFVKEGVTISERARYIIVNAREVYFISQYSLASFDDKAIWDTFEASLNIKK